MFVSTGDKTAAYLLVLLYRYVRKCKSSAQLNNSKKQHTFLFNEKFYRSIKSQIVPRLFSFLHFPNSPHLKQSSLRKQVVRMYIHSNILTFPSFLETLQFLTKSIPRIQTVDETHLFNSWKNFWILLFHFIIMFSRELISMLSVLTINTAHKEAFV